MSPRNRAPLAPVPPEPAARTHRHPDSPASSLRITCDPPEVHNLGAALREADGVLARWICTGQRPATLRFVFEAVSAAINKVQLMGVREGTSVPWVRFAAVTGRYLNVVHQAVEARELLRPQAIRTNTADVDPSILDTELAHLATWANREGDSLCQALEATRWGTRAFIDLVQAYHEEKVRLLLPGVSLLFMDDAPSAVCDDRATVLRTLRRLARDLGRQKNLWAHIERGIELRLGALQRAVPDRVIPYPVTHALRPSEVLSPSSASELQRVALCYDDVRTRYHDLLEAVGETCALLDALLAEAHRVMQVMEKYPL